MKVSAAKSRLLNRTCLSQTRGNMAKLVTIRVKILGQKRTSHRTTLEWCRTTLEWCKCGKCAIMEKTIESFCCHEKALEYDEYDDKLTSAQNQEFTCITSLSSFVQNMLSKDVLDVDVSQYLEENWPLGDDQLEQTHKLYRLVSYRRCSRWVFTILGKKVRRVFPSCVYTCIRKEFSSPTGLYTHFKFAK